MMQNLKLVKIIKCPFCDSEKGKTFIPEKKPLEDYYSSVLGKYIPDLVEEAKKSEFKKCLCCNSVYREYYFSEKIEYKMYNTISPFHRAGWERLTTIADLLYVTDITPMHVCTHVRCSLKYYHKLLVQVCAILGGLPTIILDYGCPLFGISSSWQYLRVKEQEKLAKLLIGSENLERNKIVPANIKENEDLAVQSLREEAKAYDWKGIHLYSSTNDMFWNQGCIYNGTSCRQIADAYLYAESTELFRYKNKEDGVILSTLMNIIDHINNPCEIIENLLSKSNCLLVDCHRDEAPTLQHRYSLGFNKKYFEERFKCQIHELLEVPKERIAFAITKLI